MTPTEQDERLADAIFECRVMNQKYGHLPPERRVGAKFSAQTLGVLKGMYSDMQEADNFLDTWLPKLADLLGVDNTNAEDNHNSDGSPKKNSGAATSSKDAPASSTATDGRTYGIDLEQRRNDEARRLRSLNVTIR